MFISALHEFSYPQNCNSLNRANTVKKDGKPVALRTAYGMPNYNAAISFFGYRPTSSGMKLLQDFQNQKSGYIDFVENSDASSSDIRDFLDTTMNNEFHRKCFFDELVEHPEKSRNTVKVLVDKLGGKAKFLTWYLGKEGYVRNYERYLKDRYRNAKDVSELIKIQPNWGYWALERKQCMLRGYMTEEEQNIKMRMQDANFTFGKLPSDFGDKFDFTSLVSHIKNQGWIPYGDSFRPYIGGNYYNVEHLEGGELSAKNIYKVTVNGKNFILKMDRFCPEDNIYESSGGYDKRILKEGRLLRGDSVYLDACIDYYLQQHGCAQNAALLFYDFNSDVSLYEYVDANEIKSSESLGFIDQVEANSKFDEINKLGVYLNDIGMDFNCYRDKNGSIRLVDVGHAEYIDILKPGGNLLTIETSNLCGFSLKNTLAGLNLGMLNNVAQKAILEDEPRDELITQDNSLTEKVYSAEKPDVVSVRETNVISINSRLNLPDVSGISKEVYIDSELKKPDYSYSSLYSFKSDRRRIRNHYKYYSEYYKEQLKNGGDKNNLVPLELKTRLGLLEYYKKSILARYAGILDNDGDVILDILRAFKRELINVTQLESDTMGNTYQDKIKDYLYFYSVLKYGDR